MKVLGGPKEVGRIRISGNMTEAKECKLVNYSITGMYKQKWITKNKRRISMSWRTVIISSTAKLDYQMGYLVIRKDDVTKIHLSEIETVMIESTSVSLTAALLCELTKKKIKVIFCDEKRNPSSAHQLLRSA